MIDMFATIIRFYLNDILPYLASGIVVYAFLTIRTEMRKKAALNAAAEAWVRQFGGTVEEAKEHIYIDHLFF